MENKIHERKFSDDLFFSILHRIGVFGTVKRKLKYRTRIEGDKGLKPILESPLNIDNGRTLVDLAWHAEFKELILPDVPFIESLQKRAETYTGGYLKVVPESE